MGLSGEASLMHSNLEMYPLDDDGLFFGIRDERGRTIGSGTREVCEVLLAILTRPAAELSQRQRGMHSARDNPQLHANIRSAISL
jgi:hypothetical protein